MGDKGKLAIYWAASCGGCEISILAINEKILQVAEAFDAQLGFEAHALFHRVQPQPERLGRCAHLLRRAGEAIHEEIPVGLEALPARRRDGG